MPDYVLPESKQKKLNDFNARCLGSEDPDIRHLGTYLTEVTEPEDPPVNRNGRQIDGRSLYIHKLREMASSIGQQSASCGATLSRATVQERQIVPMSYVVLQTLKELIGKGLLRVDTAADATALRQTLPPELLEDVNLPFFAQTAHGLLVAEAAILFGDIASHYKKRAEAIENYVGPRLPESPWGER